MGQAPAQEEITLRSRPLVSTVGRNRRSALAIAAALMVAYAYFYQGGGWNQNTRFALVRAIIEHHTLRIDETILYQGRPVSGDLARHEGHLYSDKAPGASFTAVPAVLLAGALVEDPISHEGIATLSWVATVAAAAVPTVICALLLFYVAVAMGLGEAGSAFAALTFGLATPAWAYATLLFGHALAAACLMAGFAAALALETKRDAQKDALLGLAVGLAGGWATVTEYPCAVPAAVLAMLAVVQAGGSGAARQVRVATGVAVGALACATLLAAHNTAAFGSSFALGYSHEAGNFGGMKQGFMGITLPKLEVLGKILVGAYRGLLYHSPVLALAPWGLGLLVAVPKSRRAAVAATLIVAYHLLLNAAYFYWFGGACYGPRHVVPALPFLALGLAALWPRSNRALRAVLIALATASTFVTFVAVATSVQSPEWFQAPWTQYNWPSFAQGHLALNQMSFLDNDAVRVRNPVTHSWNLGEKIGLRGLASLVPLLAAWLTIFAGWWVSSEAAPLMISPAGGGARPIGPTAPAPPASSAAAAPMLPPRTPKRRRGRC